MAELTQESMLKTIIRTLDRKKAEDIQLIGIGDLTIIADYFVIAAGTSTTQTKALAEEVEFVLSQQGRKPERVQGNNGSNWIIIDYGDIVVHVFYAETRSFYQLERLWKDGRQEDISKYLDE